MDNIDIYNNSSIILGRKIPKSIISWITILIILLILLFILFLIPFNNYKNYTAYVTIEGNYSYLNIYFEKCDFPINKYNKLYIKRDLYNYEISSIDDTKVVLKVDLKDELKIQNNLVAVNILNYRTTVFEMIGNIIKKGFDL